MPRRKQTAEEITCRNARNARLETVMEAIRDGRAYLDTAFGRYHVTGYNDETGYCVTVPDGNRDSWMHRRTFLVTLESIKIHAK